MFHTEHTQMLGPTLQNIVAWVTWYRGFVHPCFKVFFLPDKLLKRVIVRQLLVS